MDKIHKNVIQLVREAGKLLNVSTTGLKIKEKTSHVDLVTATDENIQEMIQSNLKKTYPTYKFIGEENTRLDKLELTNDSTWILDPLDGTLNFTHNFPYYCISLALAVNREIQLGVVYNPRHEELFTARRGHGAYLNGKLIKCSQIQDMKDALIATEPFFSRLHPKHKYRLSQITMSSQGIRSLGSAALSLCYVAAGYLDAYEVEYTQIWDIAAGSLIIQEAGGFIRHISGEPLNLHKPAVVTAGTEQLLETMVGICKQSEDETRAENTT